MKKMLTVLILALSLIISVCDAKPCIGCSADLPDNANFCAGCMTPQPSQNLLSAQAPKSADPRERLLELFAFLDEFEGNFHELKYLNVLGKMPELKTRFQNAVTVYNRVETRLPEELKILGQLYAAKYQIFDGLVGLMKNLRVDSGFKAAILKSSLLTLTLQNRIINQFRAPMKYGPEQVELLKQQIEKVKNRTQKYTITSKYIELGKQKIPGGETLMVLELMGKNAAVMYMGPSMDNNPVEGVMSLRDLEKRTTWKRQNVEFYN